MASLRHRERLGVRKLAFASPERLRRHPGVEPGSVTVLGLVHAAPGAVEVLFDEEIWQADTLQFHLLVNTATVILARGDLERFLEIPEDPSPGERREFLVGSEPRFLPLYAGLPRRRRRVSRSGPDNLRNER